ncbi:alpha/beta hydrolase [Maricaulis parjimensis]|uniref:alpha/beta hydrolase n=1 Tax=Maricaulis parjimensis TaxID=144023 RepID=UPI0019399A25
MTRVLIQIFGLALLALATGCAASPARLPVLDPGSSAGTSHPVYITTSRQLADDPADHFGVERSRVLRFARADVWVPHNRLPGEINYPGRRADPSTEFALTGWQDYDSQADFARDLNHDLSEMRFAERDVFVFVHGFNTPFSDGLYLNAQIINDFGLQTAFVHYAWPSAGQFPAYLYDRDSAQFARDGLVETLTLLADSEAIRINLIAHSMGSLVTMEALRELSLTGRSDVLEKIDPVILASPDIDIDVFQSQLAAIDPMPEHLLVFVSARDRALQLSDQLRGGDNRRLGIGAQRELLTELGATVIDLTDLRDGGFSGHTAFASSPTLMRMANTGVLATALIGVEAIPQDSGIGTLSDLAARIIYLPARALGER